MSSRSNKSASKFEYTPKRRKSPILEKIKNAPGGPETPGEKEKKEKSK